MKYETVSSLKKKADKITSEYVRRRYATPKGIAKCYTCGKRAHWKKLQCGHFIPRSASSTRYLEDNLRVQCVGCNVFGRGQYATYARNLIKELGDQRFKELLELGNKTHQFTPKELKDIIEETKEKLKNIPSNSVDFMV